jgi:hypothetical protein
VWSVTSTHYGPTIMYVIASHTGPAWTAKSRRTVQAATRNAKAARVLDQTNASSVPTTLQETHTDTVSVTHTGTVTLATRTRAAVTLSAATAVDLLPLIAICACLTHTTTTKDSAYVTMTGRVMTVASTADLASALVKPVTDQMHVTALIAWRTPPLTRRMSATATTTTSTVLTHVIPIWDHATPSVTDVPAPVHVTVSTVFTMLASITTEIALAIAGGHLMTARSGRAIATTSATTVTDPKQATAMTASSTLATTTMDTVSATKIGPVNAVLTTSDRATDIATITGQGPRTAPGPQATTVLSALRTVIATTTGSASARITGTELAVICTPESANQNAMAATDQPLLTARSASKTLPSVTSSQLENVSAILTGPVTTVANGQVCVTQLATAVQAQPAMSAFPAWNTPNAMSLLAHILTDYATAKQTGTDLMSARTLTIVQSTLGHVIQHALAQLGMDRRPGKTATAQATLTVRCAQKTLTETMKMAVAFVTNFGLALTVKRGEESAIPHA